MAADDNPGASHQSTSAQLRDAQKRIDSLATRLTDCMGALAASQADLTAMERGRAEAVDRALELAAELTSARQELEQLRARNTEDGRRPFWGES